MLDILRRCTRLELNVSGSNRGTRGRVCDAKIPNREQVVIGSTQFYLYAYCFDARADLVYRSRSVDGISYGVANGDPRGV